MIERYFLLGVRFKWTKPPEQHSGKMIGSIIDNLQRPASPMVYDGMDGQLYNLAAPHVSTVGLSMRMNIPYSWLAYSPGYTTKLCTGGDILTGFMSGCLITVWTDDQGRRCVGHVGTIDTDPAKTITVKETFVEAMPQNTTGFNAKVWSFAEIKPLLLKHTPAPVPRVLALVTQAGEYYSILLLDIHKKGMQNTWCVGGIKKVPPMNYQALRLKFIR